MRRIVPAVLLTGALVLAAPLAASAHVHVQPEQAEAGQATDLAFSVPNESDSATTTGVRISVPEGLGDVEPKPVEGWRAKVVPGSDRVVEYTATGTGVGQGASQTFVVHAATVPAVGSLPLPVAQTYSDGTVVEWDEPTPASGEEPEHPAPTLYVQDAPPTEHEDDGAPLENDSQVASDLSLVTGLSVAALVIALGALAVGVVALLRRRR